MSELRPCPFCGSDALKISPNVHTQLLRVQCESCWATSVTSNKRSTVIEAWNRRASALPAVGDVERLAKAVLADCNWAKREQWCGCVDCKCILARTLLSAAPSGDGREGGEDGEAT